MKTSEQGLALIEQQEGYAKWVGQLLFPYQDVVGLWTVGVGHLIKPGEDFSKGITKAQAQDILQQDVIEAEHIVNTEVTVPLNQGQFDALVDFSYNLGDRLRGSTLLRLLNQKDYIGACQHIADWYMAGGHPNDVLKARRLLEIGLWEKGDQG